jgi:hypothetical protein
MITEIGIVAGEIWHYLDQKESAWLDDLTKDIDKPKEHILMSLGWLAREGHILMQKEDGGFKISLRK